jgi:hypothetical protein
MGKRLILELSETEAHLVVSALLKAAKDERSEELVKRIIESLGPYRTCPACHAPVVDDGCLSCGLQM